MNQVYGPPEFGLNHQTAYLPHIWCKVRRGPVQAGGGDLSVSVLGVRGANRDALAPLLQPRDAWRWPELGWVTGGSCLPRLGGPGHDKVAGVSRGLGLVRIQTCSQKGPRSSFWGPSVVPQNTKTPSWTCPGPRPPADLGSSWQGPTPLPDPTSCPVLSGLSR